MKASTWDLAPPTRLLKSVMHAVREELKGSLFLERMGDRELCSIFGYRTVLGSISATSNPNVEAVLG
jgi:hypothetical protein